VQTPLELGDSNTVKLGEKVVAIGSPKGLTNTVSDGVVSGFRNDGVNNLIQTSVPITFGSSGGALINEYGEVIGVTTSGIGEANLNFAVPINVVKQVLSNPMNLTLLEFYEKEHVIKYTNGKYEGEIVNGKRHGYGIMTWSDGDVYAGYWVDDNRTGKGEYTWDNPETNYAKYYKGEFLNGELHGKGEIYYVGGGHYIGDFINGKRTGTGEYYWNNGDSYKGEFLNGSKEGYGTYFYANGNYMEITWVDNRAHGYGIERTNGIYYTVYYQNGILINYSRRY
jgi:hypothetical protein